MSRLPLLPSIAIMAGVLAGCNRMPDSYTAIVRVNEPGEVESVGVDYGIAFKRGAIRVDFLDGSPLPGFALAWRGQPEVYVALTGRETAFRMTARSVAQRYELPSLDEALVLPFTSSPWMQGAWLLASDQLISPGLRGALWAKMGPRYLYRIWVHERWAIPLKFETLEPEEGRPVARYELRGLTPFANLSDDVFKIPSQIPAPLLPDSVP